MQKVNEMEQLLSNVLVFIVAYLFFVLLYHVIDVFRLDRKVSMTLGKYAYILIVFATLFYPFTLGMIFIVATYMVYRELQIRYYPKDC